MIKRETFIVLLKSEMPDDSSILGGRFVIAIKEESTGKEIWKARFVVQGYRNKLKNSLVHNTCTTSRHNTRLLVGLVSIFGFRLYSTDVIQAYLQSPERLKREVFINAPKELLLDEDKILKLLKPPYGLAESDEYREVDNGSLM